MAINVKDAVMNGYQGRRFCQLFVPVVRALIGIGKGEDEISAIYNSQKK